MLHEALPGTATTLTKRAPGTLLRRVHREVAMTTTLTHDPVLTRFRTALGEMYGSKIERVVLFGSRARGDAHAESDYDVAVFLRDLTDRFLEMNRLADLSTEILDETGAFIHAMPYPAGSYNDRTPLMLGLRADGIDL
jgi:uncharacterized protein